MEEERRRQRVLIDQAIAEEVKVHLRNEDSRLNNWHLGKEIPLAVIFFLLVQTGTIVWWAASMSAEQASQRREQAEMKTAQHDVVIAQLAVDRRQDEDARRTEDRLIGELREIKEQLMRLVPREQRTSPR